MLNQSFRRVFVTNTPNLLASGTTVDLGVGQIGIFDGTTYAATAAPTYAKNKALYFGWGRANLSNAPLMLGVSGNTELSHLVKGKNITGWRGKKAFRGHSEIITVGYDGVDVTKTLTAKCGQTKVFYLTLSGQPITTLYSDRYTTQYFIEGGPCADCVQGDQNCDNVCAETLANDLVSKINKDTKINRFVRAKKLLNCTPAQAAITGTVGYTRYQVKQTDAGDYVALGGVQSQYPGRAISVKSRLGSVTTYEFIQKTATAAPAALSNLNNIIIPDCPTCPTGYTSVASAFVHTITREDNNTDVSDTIETDYTVTNVVKLKQEFGQGTYLVLKATAITAPASGTTDEITIVGQARQSCVLTTPGTTAWVTAGTLTAYPRKYTLTLLDECNTNRLAAVQAAFPSLVVSQTANTGTESCAHRYETTVLSVPLDAACGTDEAVFTAPNGFEGVSWEPIITTPDCTGCVAGVKIESVFVNRNTDEVTYDYFTHEYDGVHIEGSQYNPDYNASPYEGAPWPVTVLQKIEYPSGDGYWVREEEIKSKAYLNEHRSLNPGIRDAENYNLQSQLTKYYDEYTLEFAFSYKVLGWSDVYTDRYHLTFYFPEGQGKQIESAINGYISSNNIDLPLVVL